MTASSPRMQWPYPSREDDPWYDFFQNFVLAVDASGYANREDRSIIWTGGGTISWDLGSQTLTWTGAINVYSSIGSRLLQVSAGSIDSWADGEVVYIDLVRKPLENRTVAFVKASQLPSSDNAMAFAVRIGNVIYFRTGMSLGDGDSVDGVAPVPGGGGGSALEIEDEGVSVDTDVVNIDFVGAGVTASQTAAGHVEVNVPGSTGSALEVEDEGVSVDTDVVNIDFVGAGVTATQTAAGHVEVDVPGSAGSALEVEDEGVSVDTDVVNIDFVGAGVTATQTAAGHVEVNVPGGGGSGQFEVDSGDNEIQPITANIGRSFIVGSQDMDDSGTANDARMFFDKSDGSFRAGTVTGAEWDGASRGAASFACGSGNTASGPYSHAEGMDNTASGDYSHAEGAFTYASGHYAHSEGSYTFASGFQSHAEGRYARATGWRSHAEGYNSQSNGDFGCHAEGWETVVGPYAYSGHAEGKGSVASGGYSHAQNEYTEASGTSSFAWGAESISRNDWSEATAGNSFDNFGDGQNIRVNAGTTTTNSTPRRLTPRYAGFGGDDIEISDNSIWGFTIRVLGRTNPDDGGDSYFAIIEGIVSRSGVNVSLVPGPSPLVPRLEVSSAGASGWSAYVEDSTDGDFSLRVIGPASDEAHWVAMIQATEIIMLPVP